MSPITPYFFRLDENKESLLPALRQITSRYVSRIVSDTFSEIITKSNEFEAFIDSITELGIVIEAVSHWCNFTEDNQKLYGCNHGMGGPSYEDGWYSEMTHIDPFLAEEYGVALYADAINHMEVVKWCNLLAKQYCLFGIKENKFYSPCLVPSFDLAVPNDWYT